VHQIRLQINGALSFLFSKWNKISFQEMVLFFFWMNSSMMKEQINKRKIANLDAMSGADRVRSPPFTFIFICKNWVAPSCRGTTSNYLVRRAQRGQLGTIHTFAVITSTSWLEFSSFRVVAEGGQREKNL